MEVVVRGAGKVMNWDAVKAEFERHHGQTDNIGKMIFSSLNEQSARI